MLRHILVASALLVPAAALAQSSDLEICETPQYAGTYVMRTGELIPPRAGQGSTKATPGVIYNNNDTTGFFATSYNDTFFFDEGRLPSTSSVAPYQGVRNSYLVTSFQFGYCTRELDTSLGGPGAEVNVLFFEDYDPCGAPTGSPIAGFNISQLPASQTLGSLACWIIDIDLTGFEFCIKADADGSFDDDGTLDSFGYGLQMVNQVGGSGTSWGGWLISGDKALSNVGDGTYYLNPGAAAGTGLGNEDVFYRVGANGQSTGCFWYGATGPLAGYYMQLTGDLDDSTCVGLDCNANGIDDLFDVQGGASLDCNLNGIPDECETDCNGNGVPDDCDIAGGGSADCNANGIPDECETDCNANGIPDDCDLASGLSLDLNGDDIPDECQPGAGTPYCFGVGCPCGNDDANAGCVNSTGVGGLLYSGGGASVGANDTALFATRLVPKTVGIFVMGSAQAGGGAGIPLYDGLLCVGGKTRRYPVSFVGPDATAALLAPATTYANLVTAGSTWNFQFWYRNPGASPCGTNANLTNAVQIDFLP